MPVTSQARIGKAYFKVNGQTASKTYSGVPTQASILVTPADADVPGGNGQVGSLSLTSDQPMAGVFPGIRAQSVLAKTPPRLRLQPWRH